LHGLTPTKKAGGHVLSCTAGNDVQLSVQRSSSVEITNWHGAPLPSTGGRMLPTKSRHTAKVVAAETATTWYSQHYSRITWSNRWRISRITTPRKITPSRATVRLLVANLAVGPGPAAGSFPFGEEFFILHITPDPLVHTPHINNEVEDPGQGHTGDTAPTNSRSMITLDQLNADNQKQKCW